MLSSRRFTPLQPTDPILDSAAQQRLQQLAQRYPTVASVPVVASGARLSDVVSTLFEVSDALAAVLLARGAIWLNNQRISDPVHPVAAHDHVALHTPPAGVYVHLRVEPAMLVYEDAAMLVVNKPPGWYSVATPWDVQGNLEYALTRFLAQRDGAEPTLHLVNRLDCNTSGALLVSKDAAANPLFQQLFSAGKVQKTYHAWCVGRPDWQQIDVETGHSRGPNGVWTLYATDMVGQPHGPNNRIVRRAHTTFRVLDTLGDATLIEALLHTGRTHQIRLHLAHLGHPILGDARYGGPTQFHGLDLPYQLLHARRLVLPHPFNPHLIDVDVLPPSLWDVLERMRDKG